MQNSKFKIQNSKLTDPSALTGTSPNLGEGKIQNSKLISIRLRVRFAEEFLCQPSEQVRSLQGVNEELEMRRVVQKAPARRSRQDATSLRLRYMRRGKGLRSAKSGVYSMVNEHFEHERNAEIAHRAQPTYSDI